MIAALHHFPLASTRFIGRAKEIQALARQLETARLVTIVGAGGCGKTRLAVECAARVSENFSDGAYFIDLAPLHDATLLNETVAAAFGVRDQPEQSLRETLFHALATKKLLLLLDNCEHLRAACADFVAALLDACPTLRVLATSREALGIPSEQIISLAPMKLQDAAELFADRARNASSVFQRSEANENAIAEICARLDHLPLAVELAAARVNLLAPAQIAARLDARFRFLKNQNTAAPARQSTLRALLDWSDELLSDAERALFHLLGVFAGSFDLEAVEGLTADDRPQTTDALDLLTGLAEKSLLVIEPGATTTRYRLLETLREYARERLRAQAELQNARAKHFAYFLQLAERAEPQLLSPDQVRWLTRLDAEQDNLRAALEFAVTENETERGLRLANALWRYWNTRARFYEGKRWFDALLAHDMDALDAPARAKALFCAGALEYRVGALERGQQSAEASLAMQRALGDITNLTLTLNLLGIISNDRADYARAEKFHHEALELRRAANDLWGAAASLNNLGLAARAQGKFRDALAYYQESLQLKRALGNETDIALALCNLGELELVFGRYARASALLQESAALAEMHGDDLTRAIALTNLTVAQRALGEREDARVLCAELLDLTPRIGDIDDEAITQINLADLARDENDLPQAAARFERALSLLQHQKQQRLVSFALNGLGVVRRLQGDFDAAARHHFAAWQIHWAAQNWLGIAETLEGLSGVAQARSENAYALQWLGAARALREEMGTPVYPFDQPLLDEIETRAKNVLGPGATMQELQRGGALSLEALDTAIRAWHARVTQPIVVTPPELDLYAFGETRVFRQGALLTSKDWRYSQAREIVFYLLSRERVSKEQLALDLWQDASPQQIRRALHRVLHHARAALGKPAWILFEDGAYSFNRALPYAYDVEQFAHALSEAHARRVGDAYLEALQRAVDGYSGDFLCDVESEWASVERAARREQFLDAAVKLGAGYFDAARFPDARAVYEKIIAHENWNEDAHRALMQCFAKMGDVPRARRQYEVLKQILRDELQAEPSRETRRLYEKLKRGDSV